MALSFKFSGIISRFILICPSESGTNWNFHVNTYVYSQLFDSVRVRVHRKVGQEVKKKTNRWRELGEVGAGGRERKEKK